MKMLKYVCATNFFFFVCVTCREAKILEGQCKGKNFVVWSVHVSTHTCV